MNGVVSCSEKILIFIALCLVGILCTGYKAEASLWENPYITFSPDGSAFTTNADETDTEWYDYDYVVTTGNESTLREPLEGEHLYNITVSGNVRVGEWKVHHTAARCIHVRKTDVANFHGIYFSKNICYDRYFSGWLPYCADCGQKVTEKLFYMSDEAAASITELDMSLAYYYRCPNCTHLEQGVELGNHVCQDISANQYNVRYHANFGKGFMPKSVHMYNNATMYEGTEVTPQKHLSLNSYARTGYEFVGWNTEMDGSGVSFGDGEEILNLCVGEQESIVLYAQWKKSRSALQLDPAGGRFNGASSVVQINGEYGSEYILPFETVEPPAGAVIHFETGGGEAVADIIGEMAFSEWSFRQPLQGKIQDGVYTFKGKDGTVDYATAVYQHKAIILPECEREGYSFGGWYFDKEGTQVAGTAGTRFLTTQETTLYAYWVELKLESQDNYQANGGAGAVNLSWEQNDRTEKTYLIYQKREGGDWEKIHSADEITTEKYVNKEIVYTGSEEVYTIPYGGYYKLTLQGAQGANYDSYQGGKGGQVTATIYFEQGEVLNYVIGGQNGYNGGGAATVYGNGGGLTSISTKERGTLLIAGGGGGATSLSGGQAGGSALGNIEGNHGQDGMAGGGGGYCGGAAGNAVVHNHSDSCSHTHEGTPNVYGGCYTAKIVCGGTSFYKTKYKEIFYYGNRDDDGNPIFCVRCGSYECPGHRDKWYQYRCLACNTVYYDTMPAYCTLTSYALGCGMEEGIGCKYADGEVLGATAAYGGSNYVKAEECLTYEEYSGVAEGNGILLIESVHIGFIGNNYLNGVRATDYAPPNRVSLDTVEIKAIDENKVNVIFVRPDDRGTTYYHRAESYDLSTHQIKSTSNQTANTLTSGIYGYRYCVDENELTNVTEQDSCYIDSGESPYIGVVLTEESQYLHLAAVDRAGNISETIHIPLLSREIIFWPVITEQMVIQESENVFKNGDEYYVKADGTASFKVSFDSRLCGTAWSNYQINQLSFGSENFSPDLGEGYLKMMTPTESVIASGSRVYKNEEIQKQYDDVFYLTDMSFTEVRRSNYCKDMTIIQSFAVSKEYDAFKIRLIPQAGVVMGDVNVLSDRESDIENSIWIVADGKGPEISGLNIPEEVFNTKDGKWEYTMQIEAVDTGSGLKAFWLEISNADNGGYEKIEDTDQDGCITLEISPEEAIFSGKFSLIAVAQDHVGNETAVTYGMDGITVGAYIEKFVDSENNIFKKGESGKLHIQTTGYIERVEVTFPEEWYRLNPSLNRTFIYDVPEFMQKEEIVFMVPLQVPDGDYRIAVKAYKGDRILEVDPGLLTVTVSGSVLDEIRTRLR